MKEVWNENDECNSRPAVSPNGFRRKDELTVPIEDEELLSIGYTDIVADSELCEEIELPAIERSLTAEEALLLHRIACIQPLLPSPSDVIVSEKGVVSLYDWFTNAINLAPILDLILNRITSLRSRKRSSDTKVSKQRIEDNDSTREHWDRRPGIRV
ncbi:hypothetical protein AB1K70_03230 [Bremerella sp. JC770]|uniref:hypothetical protein n=1 Tax=Bremerella sp. JC770 TaxID=3232137 RepID=UPI00345B2693